MKRSISRCCGIILALGLVFIGTGQGTAHAANAFTQGSPAPLHTKLNGLRPNAQGNIKSDVLIKLPVDGLSGDGYVPIEGYLLLVPTGSANGLYKGVFVDNFGGGKIYPASWLPDPNGADSDGIWTINSHVGKFVYRVTQSPNDILTIISLPRIFGNMQSMTVISAVHTYNTAQFNMALFEATQNVFPTVQGNLRITYDALNYIVTSNAKTGALSGVTYGEGVHARFISLVSGGVFIPGVALNTVIKIQGETIGLDSTLSALGDYRGGGWAGYAHMRSMSLSLPF